MGTDKSLLEIDGLPMARRVTDALLSAGAVTAACVGGDVGSLQDLDLVAHPDRWPGEGPLAGVIEALHAVGSEPTVVVLSCDLLDPDPEVIAELAARRAQLGVDLVVAQAGHRPQWTHAAWRRGCVRTLEDAFAAGERSLAGAARNLRVDPWVVPDQRAVADADAPADLRSRRGHP